MRDIKFHAWDIDRNTMINDAVKLQSNIIFHRAILETAKNVIWMQSTGLNDKNGIPIFEGDVVFNSNRTLLTLQEDKRLYLVKWQDGGYSEDGSWLQNKPSFVFEKIKFNDKKYMDLIFSKDQIEIIGNIHEHPNLLK